MGLRVLKDRCDALKKCVAPRVIPISLSRMLTPPNVYSEKRLNAKSMPGVSLGALTMTSVADASSAAWL
jgi:hypothetical protein